MIIKRASDEVYRDGLYFQLYKGYKCGLIRDKYTNFSWYSTETDYISTKKDSVIIPGEWT